MLERIWKGYLRRSPFSLWSLAILILWPLSLIYRLAALFNKSSRERQKVKVNCPVISVGNISVGGTGKTPLVHTLARFLLQEGYRVGIVSSGYGRQSSESFVESGWNIKESGSAVFGDEVSLLASYLPEARFAVDNIKAIAAQKLSEQGEVDLIIVDDGFQHYQLHRDLDIVTYDAAVPLNRLRRFPLGTLRESISAINRADIVVITRSNFARDITKLNKKLERLAPKTEIYHANFSAGDLIGREQNWPVKYLEDKSIFLFAGIGNFESFEKQVQALTADIDGVLEFSDHQEYDQSTLEAIKTAADDFDSDLILTTGKDWVKLGDFDFGREIYYLGQSVDLDPGEEKLVALVKQQLKLGA